VKGERAPGFVVAVLDFAGNPPGERGTASGHPDRHSPARLAQSRESFDRTASMGWRARRLRLTPAAFCNNEPSAFALTGDDAMVVRTVALHAAVDEPAAKKMPVRGSCRPRTRRIDLSLACGRARPRVAATRALSRSPPVRRERPSRARSAQPQPVLFPQLEQV
jgi:hypothetical protein